MTRQSSNASTPRPQMEPDMFQVAMEAAPNPMLAVVEDGSMAMVNHAAEKLFGYEVSELIGRPVELLLPEGLKFVHQQHRAGFNSNPKERPMGEERDLYGILRDGSAVPIEIGLSPVYTSSGLLIICSIVDLSKRKENEGNVLELASRLGKENERLLQLVATDSLTSLMSRQAFLDHLTALLEVSVRHARTLSLLILDIDHFKAYNDDFGHLAGDEALRQVGKILREAARRSDLVARLGGEEFGIVLPETDRRGATVFGDRFRRAIEEADWPQRPITISIGATTVGFSEAVPRPEPPELSQILTEADLALYRSKDRGRNRISHWQVSEG